MSQHTFSCVDAHTCGNPVRVVVEGGPQLEGDTMSARRRYFQTHFDWVRTGLMFEPRGHDMMSGAIIYPPTRDDCDVAILFIETSGCLPMCGHGTIGTVTVLLERGLVHPSTPGVLRMDTPAGLVEAHYRMAEDRVDSVRLFNVASFLHSSGIQVDCPELGPLTVDVAYGGNFYAIVESQENYADLADYKAADILRLSPQLRSAVNCGRTFVHPEDPTICGVSHILWTGKPLSDRAHGRNAVFYGDKAIDRSPCGTGTSARMAQWFARGKLGLGDAFIHESYIGSLFEGRPEAPCEIGDYVGIMPSIEGWARVTGLNTLFIDERDPYAHGFQVL